jgi:hypothetical protein
MVALCATRAFGVTIELPPSKDNTLYEAVPDSSLKSNALGELMFAGTSGVGDIRRAIVAFDLTSIPAGSAVQSATLTLYNTAPRSTTVPVGLYRVLADWGEGSSKASNEGRGAPATPGDATWLHQFFPDTFWSTDGGDFTGVPSDAQSVPTMGFYSWSGPDVVADVQAWVDEPSANFGWVLVGDETSVGSMKWFATRENSVTEQHPVLTVEYTPGSPTEQRTWGVIKALYR